MRRMITGKQINLVEELNKLLEIQNNIVKISLPYGTNGEASVELKVCNDGFIAFAGTDAYGDEVIGFGYDDGDSYVLIDGSKVLSYLPINVDFIQDSNENNHIILNNANEGIDIISSNSVAILGPEDYGLNIHENEETLQTYLDGQEVIVNTDAGTLQLQFDTETHIQIDSHGISMPELPTSDPEIEGVLWNDNGVLKISAGE